MSDGLANLGPGKDAPMLPPSRVVNPTSPFFFTATKERSLVFARVQSDPHPDIEYLNFLGMSWKSGFPIKKLLSSFIRG